MGSGGIDGQRIGTATVQVRVEQERDVVLLRHGRVPLFGNAHDPARLRIVRDDPDVEGIFVRQDPDRGPSGQLASLPRLDHLELGDGVGGPPRGLLHPAVQDHPITGRAHPERPILLVDLG
jgi:hypothetical protein